MKIPAVTNENTLSGVIKAYLRTGILEDAEALQSFIQYVACYMNIPETKSGEEPLSPEYSQILSAVFNKLIRVQRNPKYDILINKSSFVNLLI